MGQTILVTGGAGYIGSHVVQKLCDDGHKVVVLDHSPKERSQNADFRASLVRGDICDPFFVDLAFKLAGGDGAVDTVFHFAALKAVGKSMEDPGLYARVNIAGTMNLLEQCVRRRVRSFIFSSSCAVYGVPQQIPMQEDHPQEPANFYGHTKKVIEENLAWFSQLCGLRYSSLRYFNAAGYDLSGRIRQPEKNPTNLCPIIMEVAAGIRDKVEVYGDDYDTPDGTGVRDYIHVDDLVRAHIDAMLYTRERDLDLVVNLGTGRGYSVLEMIAAAELALGKPIPHELVGRRDGDPATLVAGSDLARAELLWEARHSDLPTIFESMLRVYT